MVFRQATIPSIEEGGNESHSLGVRSPANRWSKLLQPNISVTCPPAHPLQNCGSCFLWQVEISGGGRRKAPPWNRDISGLLWTASFWAKLSLHFEIPRRSDQAATLSSMWKTMVPIRVRRR